MCVYVCICVHPPPWKDPPSGCLIFQGNVAVWGTEGWFLLLAGKVLVVGRSQLSLWEKSLLLSPCRASVAATLAAPTWSIEAALEWVGREAH